jgi:aspartyl-tRNA(Asn)/glutamyl-tRNA(Gln) amidotransferase subunit A
MDDAKRGCDPIEDAPEICRLSVAELTAAYAKGALSPVDVAEAALGRAEAINPRFNAFVEIWHGQALAQAEASERRWRAGAPASPIDGAPTTIKDIVWVQGKTISYGSVASPPVVATQDSPSVARLRQAGAVLIGLTTTPELGWKAVTDSPLTGVTSNPWNDALTPGGSSGGAAVAAATGAGVLHLGTDGGGSIRVPASFTGIVGLKPSFGKVPAYPPSAFGDVAHIGPMARRVADAKAMLDAMAGRDASDWRQPPIEYPKRPLRQVSLRGARIGYWRQPPCGMLDPQTGRVVDAAVQALADAGAEVEPVALPDVDLLAVFNVLWLTGAARRLQAIPGDRRDRMDPGLLAAAALAERWSATDYVAAQAQRAEFGLWLDRRLAGLDAIVSPATSIPAFAKACDVPPESGQTLWTEWAGFNFPINLGQQPACVLPCGLTDDGRPVGLQVIGPRGADDGVLEWAFAIESLRLFRGAESVNAMQ